MLLTFPLPYERRDKALINEKSKRRGHAAQLVAATIAFMRVHFAKPPATRLGCFPRTSKKELVWLYVPQHLSRLVYRMSLRF